MNMQNDKLGILGGGQLARMMTPTLKKWDLSFCVLDEKDCVAAPFTRDHRIGDFRKSNDVASLKDCQRVTFDLEDISLTGIKILRDNGVLVYPSPEVMETIQDKGKQKQFFNDNDIPTAKFRLVSEGFESLPDGFIKKCKGGYDGKGVFSWKKGSEYPNDFKTDIVWEEKVSFAKELSVIVVRSAKGDMKSYEPVEMVFNDELNLIDYTLSPANISLAVNEKAKELSLRLADKLNHVGVLTVEMFLLENDSLLVNELAPRPHNSGHHTIESCTTSQFENHLRAVCDFPLGSCKQTVSSALTFNVLGTGKAGRAQVNGLKETLEIDNVFVHIYGKKQSRPGRKMGHVTILGESADELTPKFDLIKEILKVEGC